jgi:hypothetical protein
LTSSEAERSVVKGLEKLGDLARVATDADPHRVIDGENVIEDVLGTLQLVLTRLALLASPVRVLLGKSLLELNLGCKSADVGLVAAVVTCTYADTLAKKLLDDRHKRLALGEVQALECLVGGLDAAA